MPTMLTNLKKMFTRRSKQQDSESTDELSSGSALDIRSSLLDTNGHYEFNGEQVELIKTAWQVANADGRPIGVNILIHVLAHQPTLTKIYKIDEHASLEDMRGMDEVQVQGCRIQAFLDNLVASLGRMPEDVRNSMCSRVGAVHYRQGVNFDETNWRTFISATLSEVIPVAEQTAANASEVQWRRLLQLCQEQMSIGFLNEARRALTQSVDVQRRSFKRDCSHARGKCRKQSSALQLCSRSTNTLARHCKLSLAGGLPAGAGEQQQQQQQPRSPCSLRSFLPNMTPQSHNPPSPTPAVHAEHYLDRLSHLLRRVWRNSDTHQICAEILLEFISQKPAYGRHFGVTADMDAERIYCQPLIQTQIKRIQTLFDTIFEMLGFVDIEQIGLACRRVGEIHFYRGVNFTADNWVLFKKIMQNAFCSAARQQLSSLSASQYDDCIVAVHRLVQLVVHEMKQGFIDCVLLVYTRTTNRALPH